MSPKASTNESKNVELSEHVHESDTTNESGQKQSNKESPLANESIDRDILELREKVVRHSLVENQADFKVVQETITPTPDKSISELSPYKTRILLLKNYTNSIMSEVRKVQSMDSATERFQAISLIEDQCKHIANLLNKIIPYIVLGILNYKSRAGIDGAVVRGIQRLINMQQGCNSPEVGRGR
eukprot:TRINITY_DN3040_c0_g2_i2.p4 TRINITY_DN3040_c0_g2~~TRINITY_DN3040_c0_g2_i2.p4  ORF type:complete len:184 (-),score=13.39 TRINITY_DN3040_c0_g2_i2:301-852(-)